MRTGVEERDALSDEGYLLLPNLMGANFLKEVRSVVEALYEAEGERAGSEFKQEPGCRRLANLVNKGEVFQRLISHEHVLPLVSLILGEDFKLSSLNARRVLPGCAEAQPLHADMAAVADEHGFWVCNTIWMLDDFTLENGAPRVVPGSHLRGQLPADALADVGAPHPDQRVITGLAGSVIVMNAHAWHGGMPNLTGTSRTAVHAFYARQDKPQQQYQKRMLDPLVQASLSPELRLLLALDDPANDALSGAAEVVRSGFMK